MQNTKKGKQQNFCEIHNSEEIRVTTGKNFGGKNTSRPVIVIGKGRGISFGEYCNSGSCFSYVYISMQERKHDEITKQKV